MTQSFAQRHTSFPLSSSSLGVYLNFPREMFVFNSFSLVTSCHRSLTRLSDRYNFKLNDSFVHLLTVCSFLFLVHRAFSCLAGALFTENERDGPTELAFKYAVYRINKDRALLPNATMVYDIQYIPKDDSFHAAKRGEYFSVQSALLSDICLAVVCASSRPH